jgi:hypothetical protein
MPNTDRAKFSGYFLAFASIATYNYVEAQGIRKGRSPGAGVKNRLRTYIKFLKVELEDLEDDLLMIQEIHNRRHDSHEITPYVFMENMSLLKKEFEGIRRMVEELDSIDTETITTIQSLRDHIDARITEWTRDASLPEAVRVFIRRRLDKIDTYMLDIEQEQPE